MLIVKVKEGENIERALKRFKRKVNETHLVKKLRERQTYNKPGEVRRAQKQKAIYAQKLKRENEI